MDVSHYKVCQDGGMCQNCVSCEMQLVNPVALGDCDYFSSFFT